MAEASIDDLGGNAVACSSGCRPHLVPLRQPACPCRWGDQRGGRRRQFRAGRLLFQGAGAGDGPTASAVVADIIDIARMDTGFEADHAFSMPVAELEAMAPAESGGRVSSAYIRFSVADRPGVLAEITAAMRDAGVSIESLIQHGRHEEGGEVLVAMVTHEGPESAVTRALALLEGSPSLTAPPLWMGIIGD
jgi:homoserine dehydrogenase